MFGFLKEHEDLDIETISINMSMEQFDNPQLCQSIEAIFKKWMISPEKIRFEITERMISEDAVKAKETVQQMADLGFWFYLDDFGIGYSNFATVSQFHFECIKLDRSLVDVMEEGPKGFDLVRGLIQLFHNMGMQVVAEGAETYRQADMLIGMGADRIQGFYYARPMPADKLIEFLKREQ